MRATIPITCQRLTCASMVLLGKTLVAVAPPPRAHMLALLADLDADHDGKLDASEFEAFVVWLTGGLLARAALQVRAAFTWLFCGRCWCSPSCFYSVSADLQAALCTAARSDAARRPAADSAACCGTRRC